MTDPFGGPGEWQPRPAAETVCPVHADECQCGICRWLKAERAECERCGGVMLASEARLAARAIGQAHCWRCREEGQAAEEAARVRDAELIERLKARAAALTTPEAIAAAREQRRRWEEESKAR